MTRNKMLIVSVLTLFVALALTLSVRQARSQGQKGYPKYCCTDAGVLGPYNNDSVPEGGACFGTKDGKRHEGIACYGKEKKEDQENKGYPKYCCTDAGRLGPYKNDSVPEGGACFGTKDGKRHEGRACY